MLALFLAPAVAALLRWIAFSAASIIVGVAVFVTITREGADEVARASRLWALVRNSAVALLAVGVLRLAQQALALAAEPSEAWPMVGVLLGMTWGYAWLAQMTGALWLSLRPDDVTASRLTGVGAFARWVPVAAMLVAPAFQGHAVGSPEHTVLAVLADIAHLVGAGVWIGTLIVMVAVAFRAPGPSNAAGMLATVRAFSPWALTGAATLGATGLFATWLHVRQPPLLWGTDYGRLVLLKTALVGSVALVGAFNWKRLTPQLAQPDGAARMATSARAEVLLALVVLAVTAVLVATPLPNE